MQVDEPATVETLNAYRVAMRRVIERHQGRVVNASGDALLAEFYSAGNRIDASVAIASIGRELKLEVVYDKVERLKAAGAFYG